LERRPGYRYGTTRKRFAVNESHSRIAFIQSRLPYTDRRALSEAWFSALHLASDGPPARGVPERRGRATARTTKAGARVAREIVHPAEVLARNARFERRVAGALGAPEALRMRRDATGALAAVRSPEAMRSSYPPFRTSLTIGLEQGRVQLLLRRDGGTLHVVALCRPQLAETVRRALALADAHLRTRGESLRSSVRSVRP
jgi:hypothetical protein